MHLLLELPDYNNYYKHAFYFILNFFIILICRPISIVKVTLIKLYVQ